jgi:TonB family protein
MSANSKRISFLMCALIAASVTPGGRFAKSFIDRHARDHHLELIRVTDAAGQGIDDSGPRNLPTTDYQTIQKQQSRPLSSLEAEKSAVTAAQKIPASDLDSELPPMPFATWLKQKVGPGNDITWQLGECGDDAQASLNTAGDIRACVEAISLLPDSRRVIVRLMVGGFKQGVTGSPSFYFGVVDHDGDLRMIRRLRDLENLLFHPEKLPKKPPVTFPNLRLSAALKPPYPSPAWNGADSLSMLNGGEPGLLIQDEEPPPKPPDIQSRSSPPSLNQPQSVQQVVDDVLEGNAITRVEPTYPPTARLMRAFGEVKVQITVSETGAVIEAKAISGHQALRSAAVDAAKKWVFKPTTVDGVPIKVQGVLTFNFTPKIQRED